MLRRDDITALCTLLALAGCARTASAPWRDLPETGLRVRAADPVAVTSTSRRDTMSLRPGTRSPTVLTLTRDVPPGATPHDRSLALPCADRRGRGAGSLRTDGGLMVRFGVTHLEGGSGGSEATVDGEVATSRGTVHLSCHAQAESDEPERSCLALLATLSES